MGDRVAFSPPLIISDAEIDAMFDRFADALSETEKAAVAGAFTELIPIRAFARDIFAQTAEYWMKTPLTCLHSGFHLLLFKCWGGNLLTNTNYRLKVRGEQRI